MADIEDPWASSAAEATPTATPSKPIASGGITSVSPEETGLPTTPGPARDDETTTKVAHGAASLSPIASTTDTDPWADPWGAGAANSTSAIASSSSSVPTPASPSSPKVDPSSAMKSWGDQEPVISRPTLTMTDGIELDDGGGWGGPIALPSPSAADIISRTAAGGAGEEEKPWGGAEMREGGREEMREGDRETATPATDEPTSSPPSEPVTSEGPAAAAALKLTSVFSGWRLGRVVPRPQESSLSSAAAAANAAAKESATKKEKERAAAAPDASSSTSPFPSLPFSKAAQPAATPADQLPMEGPGWKQTTKKAEPGLASKVAGFFAGGAAAGVNTATPPVVSAAEDEEDEDQASNQAIPAPPSAPTPPQGSAVARLFARWKHGGGGEVAAGFDVGKLGKNDLAWLERLQEEEMAKGGGPGATSTSKEDWLGEFETGGGALDRASSSASSSSQRQPTWAKTRATTAKTTKAPDNSLLDFDPLGPVEQPQSRRSVEQAQPRSSLSREHRPDPRYFYDEDEVEASSARKAVPDQPYSDRFDVALPPRRAGAFDNEDDDEFSAFQESPRLGGQARVRDEPRSVTPRLQDLKTYSPKVSLDRSSIPRSASPVSVGSGGGASLPASKRTSINLVHAQQQQQRAASPLGGNRGPLLPPPPPSGRPSRGNVTSTTTTATSSPPANAHASLSSGPGLTKDDLSFFESL